MEHYRMNGRTYRFAGGELPTGAEILKPKKAKKKNKAKKADNKAVEADDK